MDKTKPNESSVRIVCHLWTVLLDSFGHIVLDGYSQIHIETVDVSVFYFRRVTSKMCPAQTTSENRWDFSCLIRFCVGMLCIGWVKFGLVFVAIWFDFQLINTEIKRSSFNRRSHIWHNFKFLSNVCDTQCTTDATN